AGRGGDRAARAGELHGSGLLLWHRARYMEGAAFLLLEPAERRAHQAERVVGEEDIVGGIVEVFLGERVRRGGRVKVLCPRAHGRVANALAVTCGPREVRGGDLEDAVRERDEDAPHDELVG